MTQATCLRGLVAAAALIVASFFGESAACQEEAKPKVLFVMFYINRDDNPQTWTAGSKHEDYADAQKALKRMATIEGIIGVDIIPVDPKTGKQVPWPSDIKRPDQPKGKLPESPKELPARKSIVVRVYKGKEEQPDKKLETDKDYDRAKEYFNQINKTPGLRASWNAPGWLRPDIDIPKTNWVDIGPYAGADRVVGTWERTEDSFGTTYRTVLVFEANGMGTAMLNGMITRKFDWKREGEKLLTKESTGTTGKWLESEIDFAKFKKQ